MKLRNRKVAKRIGKRTLAGLLIVGMAVISPMGSLADTSIAVMAEESGQEGTQTPKTPEDSNPSETPENPDESEEPKTPENSDTSDTTKNPEDSDKSTQDKNKEDKKENEKKKNEAPAAEPQELSAAEKAAAEDPNAAKSNEELVARQQIVEPPEIEEDFRFWTVAKKYGFAKLDLPILEKIPEAAKQNAETSGETAKVSEKITKTSKAIVEEMKAIEQASQVTVEKEQKSDVELAEEAADRLRAAAGIKRVSEPAEIITPEEALIQQKTVLEESVVVGILAEKAALADTAVEARKSAEEVRFVGTLEKNGMLYIIKEENKGWLYVESGNVRGFVKASDVFINDAAQELLTAYREVARAKARKSRTKYTGIGETVKTAEELVSPLENQAYTHIRATANQTVVEKNYALANEKLGGGALPIYEDKNEAARVFGTLQQGGLCYILENIDQEWTYVESGNVRGFVKTEYLTSGEEVKKQVEQAGEAAFATAAQTANPKENGALYYTLTSVKAGTQKGEVRKSILEYASQFIGNPYVWGGTSLTNGADCSGFVQQIYKAYGYDLPRVAEAQSRCGTQIAVEAAQPGDLIFYAKNGYVYHVVIYAGNGKTIEAANEAEGIIRGNVNTADAVWATRLLDEEYHVTGAGVGEVNATESMYGNSLGEFKITYYCPCETCCNKANSITATGTPLVEGKTIAVDPSVIAPGTKVIIGGHVYTAENSGGTVNKNQIAVFVNSHEEVEALGTSKTEVFLVK